MKLPPDRMASNGPAPRPDLPSTMAALRELDVFPGASDTDLHTIAVAGRTVSIPQSWSLIWEKTPADKAYVVLEGTASVRREHEEFATVVAGQIVGEQAIVNHKLRNATVVAATPMQVLHFTREAVEELRRTVPAFREAVETSAAGRLA